MRYLTAGESHGLELTAIIEGLPAGLPLSVEDINKELARRQKGYGRGNRMNIEHDKVKISSGVRFGKTLGSPVTLVVANKDWENWQQVMSIEAQDTTTEQKRRIHRPRPGHADLVGAMKYGHHDLRNVLERSSARETTMQVAIGAVAKKLLKELDIEIAGFVANIGGFEVETPERLTIEELQTLSENSPVRVLDKTVEKEIIQKIDQSKKNGDTLGGICEVRVSNLPVGLGSYVQADRKLDGKLAQAVLSINAFKGVEFGLGFKMANLQGSQVMDEIVWNEKQGFSRKTNHLGGLKGGMTNGEDLIVRGVMKPIPTLYKPLQSVDIDTKEPFKAQVERSDVTAVPSASVVMENVIASVLAKEVLEMFDGDNFERLKEEVARYREEMRKY